MGSGLIQAVLMPTVSCVPDLRHLPYNAPYYVPRGAPHIKVPDRLTYMKVSESDVP